MCGKERATALRTRAESAPLAAHSAAAEPRCRAPMQRRVAHDPAVFPPGNPRPAVAVAPAASDCLDKFEKRARSSRRRKRRSRGSSSSSAETRQARRTIPAAWAVRRTAPAGREVATRHPVVSATPCDSGGARRDGGVRKALAGCGGGATGEHVPLRPIRVGVADRFGPLPLALPRRFAGVRRRQHLRLRAGLQPRICRMRLSPTSPRFWRTIGYPDRHAVLDWKAVIPPSPTAPTSPKVARASTSVRPMAIAGHCSPAAMVAA
jgi:hypothetical protein